MPERIALGSARPSRRPFALAAIGRLARLPLAMIKDDVDVLSNADTEPIPSIWLETQFDDTPDQKLVKALERMIEPEYADFWGEADDKPSLKRKKWDDTPLAWRKSLKLQPAYPPPPHLLLE